MAIEISLQNNSRCFMYGLIGALGKNIMIDLNNIGLPVNGEYVVEVTDHAFLEAEKLVQETKMDILRKAQDLTIKTGADVALRVKFAGSEDYIYAATSTGGGSAVKASTSVQFELECRKVFLAFELKALEVFGG